MWVAGLNRTRLISSALLSFAVLGVLVQETPTVCAVNEGPRPPRSAAMLWRCFATQWRRQLLLSGEEVLLGDAAYKTENR